MRKISSLVPFSPCKDDSNDMLHFMLAISLLKEKLRKEKQVTRGHRVGSGAQPQSTPHTPRPTPTLTKRLSKTLFDSISPMDQWTDGRTKPLIELRVHN